MGIVRQLIRKATVHLNRLELEIAESAASDDRGAPVATTMLTVPAEFRRSGLGIKMVIRGAGQPSSVGADLKLTRRGCGHNV
jgi:hypothetical protein